MLVLVLTDRHMDRLVRPSCGIASLRDGRLNVKSRGTGKEGARFYYVVADKKNILSAINSFFSTTTGINSNSDRRL